VALLSCRRIPFAIAALALCGAAGVAGPITEPQAKAQLLFNVAAFVEWPPAVIGPTDRIGICVAGDPDVFAALRPYDGRPIEGRAVSIRALSADEDPAGCHIIFISSSRDRLALVHRVANRPVITVGDDLEFARQGGALRVFFEQSRLRFEINTSTVERTKLRISSKMLNLARLVRSEHEH
jgi:hypothetical protein